MPLQSALTVENLRNDPDIEVPASIGGPRMARVQVRLVLDSEFLWGKLGFQALPNPLFAALAQGSTRLNGLTVTLWYTPASI